jgi:serine/threonine protein kinase
VKLRWNVAGKQIDGSLTSTAVDLKVLCQRLRQSHMRMQQQQQQSVVGYAWSSVPDSAYELLKRLLDVDPFTRITASEALEHPFFAMPL